MDIFTITETFWNESQEELIDTGKIIGFCAVSSTGAILGEGESPSEAIEKALTAMYSKFAY